MTGDFANFPSILWKIEGITVPQTSLSNKRHYSSTTISPTISFMEMEWKLKFTKTYDESSGVGRIDLVLVRLKPYFSSLETQFQIETGIKHNEKHYIVQKTSSRLKNKLSCIWTDSIYNIHAHIGGVPSATFYIWVTSLSYLSGTDSKADDACTSIPPACAMRLSKDFRKLFYKGEYADVVLKCGREQFPAHRAILAARSSVFAAMFRNDMKEARENVVEIKGVEPDVLEKLLCYMYSGNIDDLPMDSVRQIYLAADMYDVEPLTMKCSSLTMDKYVKDPKKYSLTAENKLSDAVGNDGEVDDEDEQKGLLKELFQSIEWQAMALRYPELACNMCKALVT